MTHYLYIPYKQKNVPSHQKNIIDQWVQLKKSRNQDIEICYQGEKKLKNLPSHADISILLFGTPGDVPVFSGSIGVETACHFPSAAGHFTLNDAPHSQVVPHIAQKMIEDGLFDNFNDTHLHIKLFFWDAESKTQKMVSGFFELLQKDLRNQKGTIKLDSYQLRSTTPVENTMPANLERRRVKMLPPKLQRLMDKEKEFSHSFYNHAASYPQLSQAQISAAVKQYHNYKSSRCLGLSGVLGLNGLFSSDASYTAVNYLVSTKNSAQDKFYYASQFLKKFPHNQLSHHLTLIINESLNNNLLNWSTPSSEHVTLSK